MHYSQRIVVVTVQSEEKMPSKLNAQFFYDFTLPKIVIAQVLYFLEEIWAIFSKKSIKHGYQFTREMIKPIKIHFYFHIF